MADNDVTGNKKTAVSILEDDVHGIFELVEQEDSTGSAKDRHRRSLVRAIFAYIEGAIWNQKQSALFHPNVHKTLPPHEIALLTDESYTLNKHGTFDKTSQNIPFLHNCRFSDRAYRQTYGFSEMLDTSEYGWSYLVESVSVRNRLMHPKKAADLVISDKELVEAVAAFSWYRDQYLIHSIVGSLALSVGKQAAELWDPQRKVRAETTRLIVQITRIMKSMFEQRRKDVRRKRPSVARAKAELMISREVTDEINSWMRDYLEKSHKDNCASESEESKEIISVIVETRQEMAENPQPCKKPPDLPASPIAAQ